jgi:hypothetical protein
MFASKFEFQLLMFAGMAEEEKNKKNEHETMNHRESSSKERKAESVAFIGCYWQSTFVVRLGCVQLANRARFDTIFDFIMLQKWSES